MAFTFSYDENFDLPIKSLKTLIQLIKYSYDIHYIVIITAIYLVDFNINLVHCSISKCSKLICSLKAFKHRQASFNDPIPVPYITRFQHQLYLLKFVPIAVFINIESLTLLIR